MQMPGIKNFTDKTIVVTGASSGIGRATALAFAAERARLILVGRDASRLDDVRRQVAQLGAEAVSRIVDVADREQMERFAGETLDQWGHIDILFNNAGVSQGRRFANATLNDWDRIVGVNFWGVVYGVHFFLPSMIARRQGHIVTTASAAGLCPTPETSAYCATKAAVVSLSESLRAEMKPHNIGVSVICPGVIKTSIVANSDIALEGRSSTLKADLERFYERWGWPPEKVARAVLKAVRRNTGIVPVGPEVWTPWLLKRFSQRLYQFATYRIWRMFVRT
jgi:NADP-dependent 3-hydroxy acid dehydrogenase YdfG